MKNKITLAIIASLLLIVIVQKTCKPPVQSTTKVDTLVKTTIRYIHVHDTIYKTVKKYVQIPPKEIPPKYLPDTNYAKLKKQFQQLVNEHLSKNVYIDTLKLDTLGSITIKDTTQYNRLGKRGYLVDLKIPKRIDSVFITTPAPAKRQVYAGIGTSSTQTLSTFGLRGSLLYKDKKDNMFNPSVTFNTNGTLMYGVDVYFKLKLK
jgi:hypothetical protein